MSFFKKRIGRTENTIPSGAIMWFYSSSAPAGWVICNGKYYSTDGSLSSATQTATCTVATPDLIYKYPIGATSNVGDTLEGGLPNINGWFEGYEIGKSSASAFKFSTNSPFYYAGSGTQDGTTSRSGTNARIGFNANLANTTYGRYDNVTDTNLKNKVIPPSVKLLPCMKL